ncbi:5'-flap endonuclease [Aspergillus nanangensis]|uniref:Structure-specific endonuclease subunit SLX4 n=1 Tax=Aspergillus nanangensis TaxID=2582783 RepID=A0AAD4GQP3_ASPNN|nr:5'-flap endonuclease [Aspergillus nanangensis]
MNAIADIIVLSSSPERPASRAPEPPIYEPSANAPTCESPESILSPSELCQLPMRSKYFQPETQREKKRKKTPASKTSDGIDNSPGDTTQPKEGKLVRGSMVILDGLESLMPKQKMKPPKTNTGVKKKRGKDATSTNKTITGKIAKSVSMEPSVHDKSPHSLTTPQPLRGKFTNASGDWEKDGLQLEVAMKRRLDWTPTKNTSDKTMEMDERADNQADQSGFGDLLSGYSFNGDPGALCNGTETVLNEGPTKRRRIYIADPLPNADNVNEGPKEGKKQRGRPSKTKEGPKRQGKKPTTLTARVTARYHSDYTEGPDTQSEGAVGSDEVVTGSKKKTSRSKRKNTVRPREPEVVILSPEEAAKSFKDQDLVFGTCSQLEQEDSPTMLHDLQTAIEESEKSNVTEPVHNQLRPVGRKSLLTSTVSRFITPKKLWSVAARDVDGSLMDAEVLDLTETPDYTGRVTIQTNENPAVDTYDQQNSSLPGVEEESPMTGALSATPIQHSMIVDNETTQIGNNYPDPRPSMPQYSSLTDAQLSKQVAEFGFKALKNRRRMIELLEKCWESKYGPPVKANAIRPQDESNLTPPVPQGIEKKACKAKKPQKSTNKRHNAHGTCRSSELTANDKLAIEQSQGDKKCSSTPSKPTNSSSRFSYMNVEEIEDSEEEIIPSPSRLQNLLRNAPTKDPESLSVPRTSSSQIRATSSSASTAVPSSNLPCLADQVTQALRTQSRLAFNRSRKDPTWHEKIVMYDPIIIEDFTVWLNTEGLSLVNEDREVNPEFLRQWCQNRGICCCYRRLNKV